MYCFDVMSTVCQQRSECKTLDSEETLKRRSLEYNNLMRSKCLYCTLAFVVVFITVNTLFLLFSFITIEALSRWWPYKFCSVQSAYVSLC